MTNVHAYTENHHPNPAYISINRDDTGAYRLSVRSRDGHAVTNIAMTPDQLEKMAGDILKHQHEQRQAG